MTPVEFKAWRKGIGLTQQAAADALGISRSRVELYEAGRRRDDNRLVEIPVTVELACAAIRIAVRKGIDPAAPNSLRAWAASRSIGSDAD